MSTNLAPPTLQTPGERPISFLLDDTVSGAGPVEAMTLYVRPEELTRQDPSRVNIVQTLGGAWGDSFGPGVSMINISGTTGWRRDQAGDDGGARFEALRDRVFKEWHARRSLAIKAGQDPSGVQLIFSDALDNFSGVVAPMNFVLRRSRSRPLLCQYQIQMAVLEDDPGAPLRALESVIGGDILRQLGLDSLANSIDTLAGFAMDVQNFVDRNIAVPVRGFMNTTEAVLRRVQGAINTIDGASSSLINVAQMAARSGANMFHTFAAVANIPARIRGRLIQIATAYTNVYCVLRNALRARLLYEDYGDIYGASNCSSTAGGRPLSPLRATNTFQYVVPAPVAPVVSVSPDAQSALATMSGNDIVQSPMDNPVWGQLAGSVATGVVLA